MSEKSQKYTVKRKNKTISNIVFTTYILVVVVLMLAALGVAIYKGLDPELVKSAGITLPLTLLFTVLLYQYWKLKRGPYHVEVSSEGIQYSIGNAPSKTLLFSEVKRFRIEGLPEEATVNRLFPQLRPGKTSFAASNQANILGYASILEAPFAFAHITTNTGKVLLPIPYEQLSELGTYLPKDVRTQEYRAPPNILKWYWTAMGTALVAFVAASIVLVLIDTSSNMGIIGWMTAGTILLATMPLLYFGVLGVFRQYTFLGGIVVEDLWAIALGAIYLSMAISALQFAAFVVFLSMNI